MLDESVQVAMPGDTLTFEVKLLEPAAVTPGLRFAMRVGTVTLGAGIILELISE